ncbi:GAF domain-containing protein [Hymenobacter sp. YC55]|uniref:GAF domain-containing protein n=1 Tax=Hymenobacter sp. YC55 TaxID=3034019 RepID=UPI0023F7E2D9|nr:GAF domain-containing protein [Hymenobacter sp. YC55]MDF7811096.1 GAF domain-containing protein [Hymenobacter sp. YC55]
MSLIPQILIPTDEMQRLRSIHRYDAALSLQESVFGEFVALAARIFNLPISLIALVDKEQVSYKANYGLPNVQIQPREEALCSTAILDNKAVVYADLTNESSPLITNQAAAAARDKKLRFYAAAPLRMPDERRIGSLCIIDYQPRYLSEGEQQLLEQIATLVSQMVAVRYCCLQTPELGEDQWFLIRNQVQEELQGLQALVRYLATRHGSPAPIPEDILTLISRRLNDLREVLDQYES